MTAPTGLQPDYRGDYSTIGKHAPCSHLVHMVAPDNERADYKCQLSPIAVVRAVVTRNPQKSAILTPLTTRLLLKSQKERNGKNEKPKGYARARVVSSHTPPPNGLEGE